MGISENTRDRKIRSQVLQGALALNGYNISRIAKIQKMRYSINGKRIFIVSSLFFL